jgi:hypothetical protein
MSLMDKSACRRDGFDVAKTVKGINTVMQVIKVYYERISEEEKRGA